MTRTRSAVSLSASLRAACALLLVAYTALTSSCSDGFEEGEDLPGGATTNTLLLGSLAFSRLADNASADSELLFFSGNSFFNQGWVAAPSSTQNRDGLGPVYNARSCAACHFRDGRGRPPAPDAAPDAAADGIGLLVRLSVPGVDGTSGGPVGEPTYGGQLQTFALPDVPVEGRVGLTLTPTPGPLGVTLQAPSYTFTALAHGAMHAEALFSPRVAPQMIGLGLLEAIPEARLRELADDADADADGVSGRVATVFDVVTAQVAVGRFGWKAEQPSVRQQSAGAFNGDLGITTSLFPNDGCTDAQEACRLAASGADDTGVELRDDLLDRVAAYSSLLAPPIRPDARVPEVLVGKRLFGEVGCAACHTPSHVTGTHPTFPELSNQKIWPYTDLLLHDLGPALTDNRPVFDTAGAEWRTPPLWGLGRIREVNGHLRLMHDGRADGVLEAVLWHGGEAQQSVDAFVTLDEDGRAALIRFVESL